MLQSYRGLHVHAFGPAESKPTDHMQDGRHSPNLATSVFGRDATEMCNGILNWFHRRYEYSNRFGTSSRSNFSWFHEIPEAHEAIAEQCEPHLPNHVQSHIASGPSGTHAAIEGNAGLRESPGSIGHPFSLLDHVHVADGSSSSHRVMRLGPHALMLEIPNRTGLRQHRQQMIAAPHSKLQRGIIGFGGFQDCDARLGPHFPDQIPGDGPIHWLQS